LYRYRCRSCGLETESGDRSGPVTPPCFSPDLPHAWIRGTDPRHHAFHEAAHAVVASRLGGRVHSITLVRNVGYATRYEFEPYAPEALVATLAGAHGERLLGVVPAGDVADRRRFRFDVLEWLMLGLIGTEIGHLPAEGFSNVVSDAIRRAEADFDAAAATVVADSSKQIEHLAAALVVRREMDGDEVRKTLSQTAFSRWMGDLGPLNGDYRDELWRAVLLASA
jgi:hypothetical protein